MQPELKKKWVEALRSGEYRQGRDRLYDATTGSHCCLGVLAEVCEFPRDDAKHNGYYSFGGFVLVSSLGPINSVVGLNNLETSKLIDMNDSGRSFNSIADWIEENVNESAP